VLSEHCPRRSGLVSVRVKREVGFDV